MSQNDDQNNESQGSERSIDLSDLPADGWYLETSQGLQGPHSLESLRQQALANALLLKQRVLHPDANLTLQVHELFPTIDSKLSPPQHEKTFRPPPRPAEAEPHRSVPNDQKTQNIDYLSLLQKGSVAGPAAGPGQKPSGRSGQVVPLNTGFKTEVSSPSDSSSWSRAAVASLLVGVVGAGLARYYYSDNSRAPAAASAVEAEVTNEKPKAAKKSRTMPGSSQGMPSALGNAIGAGRNPVARDLGSGSRATAVNAANPHQNPEDSQRATASAASPSTAEAPQPVEQVQHYDPAQFDLANRPVTPPEMSGVAAGTDPNNPSAPAVNPGDPNVQIQGQPPNAVPPPVDPATGQPVDPNAYNAGNVPPPVDPATGQPVAPPGGDPNAQAGGENNQTVYIDPTTGQPAYPNQAVPQQASPEVDPAGNPVPPSGNSY